MVMTTARHIFVDTNILIRATIDAAPLHREARLLLDNLWEQKARLVISHQVIREYVANTTRLQTYSPALPIRDVLNQVADFRKTFEVVPDAPEVLHRLLELIRDVAIGGKQVHDANIVATMLAYEIPELVTHNVSDFARFDAYIQITPLTSKA